MAVLGVCVLVLCVLYVVVDGVFVVFGGFVASESVVFCGVGGLVVWVDVCLGVFVFAVFVLVVEVVLCGQVLWWKGEVVFWDVRVVCVCVVLLSVVFLCFSPDVCI